MELNAAEIAGQLYREFGPPKKMGQKVSLLSHPHFFLLRKFFSEQDLAILFNTKRCRYQCKFCALPAKASKEFIDQKDIVSQYIYVLNEVKHALGLIDRLTIANEGSVFDESTFPQEALFSIVESTVSIPNIKRLVFESRLEFVDATVLALIKERAKNKEIEILTGFETLDTYIRDQILGKREPLESFLNGLDKIGDVNASLTAYVLFKPSPLMTDKDAIIEANRTIEYLNKECKQRKIDLTVRLNPMYAAFGTKWRKDAEASFTYQPPRLTDVLHVYETNRKKGIPIYIGLTSEGLAESKYTYRNREDFNIELLKSAIINNTSLHS